MGNFKSCIDSERKSFTLAHQTVFPIRTFNVEPVIKKTIPLQLEQFENRANGFETPLLQETFYFICEKVKPVDFREEILIQLLESL